MKAEERLPAMTVVTKLPRIQILRFVAATAVVLFHSLGTGLKYFPGSSRLTLFHFGDLGVDMFFVISGFIIFLTVSSRERTWSLFLRRRLGRIVPMYWLMTLIMAGLLMIPGPSRSPPPGLGFLLRSLFYVSWTTGEMPVLYPGWSLEYEMFYYLMVTGALALAPARWTRVVFAMAALVIAGAVARSVHIGGIAVGFFSDAMQLEFALGIVTAQAVLQRRVSWTALLAIGVALIALANGPPSERLWRVVVAGLPSVILVGAFAWADIRRPLRNAAGNWLVKLGDASYSIYLIHVMIISIEAKILVRLWGHVPVDVAIAVIAVTTLVAGYGVHLGIERPITRWIKPLTTLQNRKERIRVEVT